ncbi:MAG: GTPase [Planctomycetota bacterium]
MGARELTARAPGAVRVLEVAGDARVRLAALFARPLPAAGALAFGRLAWEGETLDEALVVGRPDGELELHLHGASVVVARVLALLGSDTPAPSPATRRARLAGLLAGARTEAAARVLLDRVEGALERALAAPDDAALAELVQRGAWGPDLVTPRRVVLVGATNAGKSTLFNALLGSERVLTSDVAGTTRDAIREPWDAGGFPIELIDTAGWRAVEDGSPAAALERAGQARGRALAAGADLVVWLTARPDEPEPAGVHVLGLQADRVQHPAGRPAVSALVEPATAAAAFGALVRAAFAWPAEPWRPGRAVPVEPAEVELLARAAAARGTEREQCLRQLFASDPRSAGES